MKDKKRNSLSRGFWIGILFANALLFAVVLGIIPNLIPFVEISKGDSSGGILLIPYFIFMRDLSHFSANEENRKTFRYFNFDLLLTNPPFAGEITDVGLLRQYEFAKKNGKLRGKMERHILFIERSLDALRPSGRMAIVLPQGVLNNTNMEYIRQWLFGKAQVLAVVGLHGNTFKPHTGTKTSVLFLQKWNKSEKPMKDYPIFMAVSKKSGKDNSGDYIYKKDVKGNYVHNDKGRKVLDHDFDSIADAFLNFAKEQKLPWI